MRRFALLALVLAGCASAPTPQQVASQAEFERTIPTCEGELDCKAKWEAAQLWVAQNAGMKLQIATEVLLETYNPPEWSSNLAVKVVKEPLGGGRYRIVVSTYCRFVCNPDPQAAALDFNRKVGSTGG